MAMVIGSYNTRNSIWRESQTAKLEYMPVSQICIANRQNTFFWGTLNSLYLSGLHSSVVCLCLPMSLPFLGYQGWQVLVLEIDMFWAISWLVPVLKRPLRNKPQATLCYINHSSLYLFLRMCCKTRHHP